MWWEWGEKRSGRWRMVELNAQRINGTRRMLTLMKYSG